MEVHAVSTWADRSRRSVVVVEDDVQNVVRDIKSIDSRLAVYYNEQVDGFDIVERCLDGVERLVFSAKALDQRVVDRLRGADHWHGRTDNNHILGDDEDYAAQVDAHNEKMEQLGDAEFQDQIAYAGEAIAWALDICRDRSSVGGSILVPRSI